MFANIKIVICLLMTLTINNNFKAFSQSKEDSEFQKSFRLMNFKLMILFI